MAELGTRYADGFSGGFTLWLRTLCMRTTSSGFEAGTRTFSTMFTHWFDVLDALRFIDSPLKIELC
jgi:hypothetical protein